MRYLSFLVIFCLSVGCSAQGTDEGRISEHTSATIVAVAGLLTIAYLIRRFRKRKIDSI